jgi:hypothetical protein
MRSLGPSRERSGRRSSGKRETDCRGSCHGSHPHSLLRRLRSYFQMTKVLFPITEKWIMEYHFGKTGDAAHASLKFWLLLCGLAFLAFR